MFNFLLTALSLFPSSNPTTEATHSVATPAVAAFDFDLAGDESWIRLSDGHKDCLQAKIYTKKNQFMKTGYCTCFDIRNGYTKTVSFTLTLTMDDGTTSTLHLTVRPGEVRPLCNDSRRIRYRISNLRAA